MQCRPNCGACCIAPSINSPIPGMPGGKPAGVRCVQLDLLDRCLLFNSPDRPELCGQFSAEMAVCGNNKEEALALISALEIITVVQ